VNHFIGIEAVKQFAGIDAVNHITGMEDADQRSAKDHPKEK
jgi:hypothetical protein